MAAYGRDVVFGTSCDKALLLEDRGMFILNIVSMAIALAAPPPMPDQTYVEAEGPNGPLKGTMLSPGKDAPVVLMIPGSGPTDRDGNNGRGLKAASMKLLAEGLAANGVASVRIDKRGMYASAGAVSDANAVTIKDYAADVHSWVKSIRRTTSAKCVWILGHSEGGLVALSAGQDASGICGLVLIATPGRPVGQTLRYQLKSNPANAPVLAQALSAIADLEAGRRVDVQGLNPALMPLFHPAVQGFLMSEMALDPAKLISAVRKPVLIVQGDRDIQVGVQDAQMLKKGLPAATLDIAPRVNHVLKLVSSDSRQSNIATYSDPSLPLAPDIAPAIARFVTSAHN